MELVARDQLQSHDWDSLHIKYKQRIFAALLSWFFVGYFESIINTKEGEERWKNGWNEIQIFCLLSFMHRSAILIQCTWVVWRIKKYSYMKLHNNKMSWKYSTKKSISNWYDSSLFLLYSILFHRYIKNILNSYKNNEQRWRGVNFSSLRLAFDTFSFFLSFFSFL